MKHHDCTTHLPGTKTCYDHCGCRCYDCSYARSVYLASPNRRRVDAADIARWVARAVDTAGVTVVQVARDADVPPTTLYSIVSGAVGSVGPDTATAVLAACKALCDAERGRRLPAGPLVRAVEARAIDGIRPLLNGDTRTFYRSKARGWVTEVWADRICCHVLGMPLPLLYGTDYDQEAA